MLKLKFVYGILPAIVWYTNSISDARFGGMANGPLIRIRSKYVIDHGLLEHELTHVKQWWRTLGLHGIFYKLSSKYRFASEIEAYRSQLQTTFGSSRPSQTAIDQVVKAIQTKYDLDVSAEEISNLLLK